MKISVIEQSVYLIYVVAFYFWPLLLTQRKTISVWKRCSVNGLLSDCRVCVCVYACANFMHVLVSFWIGTFTTMMWITSNLWHESYMCACDWNHATMMRQHSNRILCTYVVAIKRRTCNAYRVCTNCTLILNSFQFKVTLFDMCVTTFQLFSSVKIGNANMWECVM